MDVRLQGLFASQLAARFAGLAGSDAQTTLRISDALLNEAIAAMLPPGGPLRAVKAHAVDGGRVEAIVTLARPTFLPPLSLHLTIERGFVLPQDPVLVFRLSGAGGLLKVAGSLFSGSIALPDGVRLERDRLFVDVRAVFAARGLGELYGFVRDLNVGTESSTVVVRLAVAVP